MMEIPCRSYQQTLEIDWFGKRVFIVPIEYAWSFGIWEILLVWQTENFLVRRDIIAGRLWLTLYRYHFGISKHVAVFRHFPFRLFPLSLVPLSHNFPCSFAHREPRSNAMGVAFTFCVFEFNIPPRLSTHVISIIHFNSIESGHYKLPSTKFVHI